jgi:Domain of unknown function (DUF4365)
VTKSKRITDEQHDGGQGERLAALLVGEMGHEFHPAQRNEAGLDGFIELRDASSGEVSAQIVLCQVKTGENVMFGETDTEFSWRAEPGDLTYWENSNAPVIVIVVGLAKKEGWWKAVDEAFADEDARARRVVRFHKEPDRLNGAPGDVLWDVVRRAQDRDAVAARMSLAGPYAMLGLNEELDTAQAHAKNGRWAEAARAWSALADAAEAKGLERRLVWPARDQAAQALQSAGHRRAAGEIWLRLAAERVADDDAEAAFDVARAQWTGAWIASFSQTLTQVRSMLPEDGAEALDSLRELARAASTARERQAAAAALVDALAFFGHYEEAVRVADDVLGKKHDTPHKRQLILDRLDCAGELGQDVAEEWETLLADWRDRGPHLYGRALQRRAVSALRGGDPAEARRGFTQAGEVWARTVGGDAQVAEAALSLDLVGGLVGQFLGADALPPGARAAAVIARGSIRTPAVRSERLAQDGLFYLADHRRPDALKNLTLAAMVDRRAGNLASWRRSVYLLGRAYEDADEYTEALRFWLMVGAEERVAELAAKVDADAVLGLVRLAVGPAWERAASFAALERHAKTLPAEVVKSLAVTVLAAAEPPPTLVAPQPSFYARRTLALLCDRLPKQYAQAAGAILATDVQMGAPNASESSEGLVKLTQRGLFDGVPVIIDALLSGRSLPVTVSGWLREAANTVRDPLIEAALGGNQIALAEAARADLPETDARLRAACDSSIQAAVRAERGNGGEIIGASFVELADIARFASARSQGRFADLLVDVVANERYDEVSKASALITLALAAPGLATAAATRALRALLPVARGAPVASAPPVIADHRNPKRARTSITRSAPPAAVRAAAIQACGRLARRIAPRSTRVGAMLREAVASDEAEVVRMALRELAGLPDLGRDVDPAVWQSHPAPAVRGAAEQLARVRRGESTTE